MPPDKRPSDLNWWTECLLPWTASFGRSLALVLAAFVLVLSTAIGRGILETTAALVRHRLPFDQSGRLMALGARGLVWRNGNAFSERLLRVWREENSPLESLAAFRWESLAEDGLTRVFAGRVSTDFFPTLGVRAELGRAAFAPRESHAAVLSHRFWRERFGADPQAVGRTLTLEGEAFQIVGVMPATFWFVTKRVDLWLSPDGIPGGALSQIPRFSAIVRLKPGVTQEQAAQEIESLAARHRLPARVRLASIEDELLRETVPPVLFACYALGLIVLIGAADLIRFVWDSPRQDRIRNRIRFAGFLALKSLVALAALTGLWLVLMDPAHRPAEWGGGGSLVAGFWIFGLGVCGLVYWSLLDQRYRCRICLRRLRMPVPTGSWSTPLLDRPGTEYICPFGHGKVNVASVRLFGIEPARWTYYLDFWRELVRQEEAARED
ncbi:MAG TPA: ABC transporter permease [Bryobacteraceae bacterium]|nr:ABC transporter permease [Bryobacteraceae bacterium]